MANQDNTERFVAAFAAIEKALNAITRRPKYIPFRTNARISARYNSVVKNYLEDICMFAELRNCIVHNRDGVQEAVAVPSDDTVAKIEHIADLLQKDHNVLNFASSPVICGEYSEPLKDALTRMDEKQIDKLPVYENGKFRGLFSLRQVLHHILVHGKDDLGLVADVMKVNMKDRVIFVDRSANLDTIVKLFDDFETLQMRPPTILVTETGGINESPLGIITLYDLARISTYLA
jgi:predicted transcriptional regulator